MSEHLWNDIKPEVSIIIRCLNEAKHIGTLFARLKEQTFRDFEVIVVDSGSTDGTLQIVEQQDATLLHIAPEDFSFGRSLNLGYQYAQGKIVVNISAHCYPVRSDWLGNLVAGFDSAHVGVVYGRQQAHPTTKFSERRILEKWFPISSVARQKSPFSNNANCAVRHDLWQRLKYDTELPGLEDIAFAQEAMRAGFWIRYRADAVVTHVHNETTSQTRNRYRREAIALQHLFPEEHFNIVDFARLYVANMYGDMRAAWSDRIILDEWRGILTFRLAQFWGAYEGFHTRWPPSSALKRHLYYPD